eukprot:EG_transcript_10680
MPLFFLMLQPPCGVLPVIFRVKFTFKFIKFHVISAPHVVPPFQPPSKSTHRVFAPKHLVPSRLLDHPKYSLFSNPPYFPGLPQPPCDVSSHRISKQPNRPVVSNPTNFQTPSKNPKQPVVFYSPHACTM